MKSSFKYDITKLSLQGVFEHLPKIKRGFEKETLRVDKEGLLAQTPHPNVLGSSLTHPMITTDYSEALLEFVTPPTEGIPSLFKSLQQIHQYVAKKLVDESLWLSSMPCKLPKEEKIPIAEYGSSNIGQLKHIYRKGLGLRYGRKMQTIAGIHYNFSFPEEFWRNFLNSKIDSNEELPWLISEQYLSLMRNCLRLGWMIPYLFGATPALCKCFLEAREFEFLQKSDPHTFIAPYATSLRLSDLGYHNKKQRNPAISYNSFPEFMKTIHHAVHTIDPEFAQFGVKVGDDWRQLSACHLQIEDEHYAQIRPKRVSAIDERMMSAMQREGIEYIELRTLDINPFNALGVDPQTIYFLDVFLLLCLLLPSPPILSKEEEIIRENFSRVIQSGRMSSLLLFQGGDRKNEKNLHLNIEASSQEVPLRDLGRRILEELMEPLAHEMDRACQTKEFSAAVSEMGRRFNSVEKLPSNQVLSTMKDKKLSYFEFVKILSQKHFQNLKDVPLNQEVRNSFDAMALQSHEAQKALELDKTRSFDAYLHEYLLI